MKTLVFALIFLAAVPTAEYAEGFFTESKPVEGLRFGIRTSASGHIDAKDRIEIGIHSVGEKLHFFRPLDEYYLSLKLTDSDGHSIPPTQRGREFGSRFSELSKTFDIKQMAKTQRGYAKLIPAYSTASGYEWFPSVEELFGALGAGEYRLSVQAQGFLKGSVNHRTPVPGETINANDLAHELRSAKAAHKPVRFEPVVVKILKREDASE